MNRDTHAIITATFMAAWGNHAPHSIDGITYGWEHMETDMRAMHEKASQLAMDVMSYSEKLEMPGHAKTT